MRALFLVGASAVVCAAALSLPTLPALAVAFGAALAVWALDYVATAQ